MSKHTLLSSLIPPDPETSKGSSNKPIIPTSKQIDEILHDFAVAESLSETQLSDKLKRKVITAEEFDDRLVENYREHKKQAKTALIKLIQTAFDDGVKAGKEINRIEGELEALKEGSENG